MMSQIPCKQSIRIEKSGWFKHYFPGNVRRNFLFKVCNYTSYQNLQKTSLPNPFAREKAGDKAGTRVFFIRVVRLYHVISFLRMSTYRSISADYSQLAL